MNATNFIFWLLHIANLPSLAILTPPCSPYRPSIDCAHLSTNCVNSFVDCDNTFANYGNFLIYEYNQWTSKRG
jgi:hypothetical protein